MPKQSYHNIQAKQLIRVIAINLPRGRLVCKEYDCMSMGHAEIHHKPRQDYTKRTPQERHHMHPLKPPLLSRILPKKKQKKKSSCEKKLQEAYRPDVTSVGRTGTSVPAVEGGEVTLVPGRRVPQFQPGVSLSWVTPGKDQRLGYPLERK